MVRRPGGKKKGPRTDAVLRDLDAISADPAKRPGARGKEAQYRTSGTMRGRERSLHEAEKRREREAAGLPAVETRGRRAWLDDSRNFAEAVGAFGLGLTPSGVARKIGTTPNVVLEWLTRGETDLSLEQDTVWARFVVEARRALADTQMMVARRFLAHEDWRAQDAWMRRFGGATREEYVDVDRLVAARERGVSVVVEGDVGGVRVANIDPAALRDRARMLSGEGTAAGALPEGVVDEPGD